MNLFKKTFSLFLALLMTLAMAIPAFAAEEKKEKEPSSTAVDEILMSYNNPNGRVLCVAKLGNPRLYPENSLEGVKSAIDIGADIITVSVQKTKDNQFVLLSEDSLSTMCVNKGDGTPAKGKVSEMTVEQLKSEFYLRTGNGGTDAKATKYTIPTLEEVIKACRNDAMIMIDNGWKYAEEINSFARTLEACDIIIIRNVPTPADAAAFIDKVGVPVCHVTTKYGDMTEGSAKEFVTASLNSGSKIVELSAEKSYSSIFNTSLLSKFNDSGRAFISTTERTLCGGRDDLIVDWADLIERGYSIIETDYPKELASYIEEIETYRAELTSLIMQAQGLNISKYTKETSKALTTSLTNAEELSGVGCVSLNQIDKARYDIQEALNDLQIKTGEEKTSLPGWGIALIIIAAILILGISAVVVLRFINKRKAAKKKMDKFKSNFKNTAPEANDHLVGLSGEDAEELSEEEIAALASDTAKADAILADLETELEASEETE